MKLLFELLSIKFKTYKFKMLLLLMVVGFVTASCNNSVGYPNGTSTMQDTTQELSYEKDSSNLVNSTPIDSMYQNNYKIDVSDKKEVVRPMARSLDIIESNIIFDDDFTPYLFIKLANYMDEDVIAIEVFIQPISNDGLRCEEVTKKIKINIPVNKTVTIKRKIGQQLNCNNMRENIFMRTIILKSGKKVHPSIFDNIKGIE